MTLIQLRPFQEKAIRKLQNQEQAHLLCVAPTGSGKSLIYEILCREPAQRTLLITPLVALSVQQQKTLQRLPIKVSRGTGNDPESIPVLRNEESGVWIISPEKLFGSESGIRWIRALLMWKPTLLVVDECHCVFEWGTRFRKSYQRILELPRLLKIPKSLWLTGTLDRESRQILSQTLPEPFFEMGEFELPPLLEISFFKIHPIDRIEFFNEMIRRRRGKGMIFVRTREMAERLFRALSMRGETFYFFHAGLSPEEKSILLKRLRSKDGGIAIATTALSMGLDIPDLEWVLLWQPPSSPYALAQMLGRVARNGMRGFGTLLWDSIDFHWPGEKSIFDLVQRQGCRKRAILNLLNSSPTEKPDCGLCDHCRRKSC